MSKAKTKGEPALAPMPGVPSSLSQQPEGYADWLAELKGCIHAAQQRATLAVNYELVLLYWKIGRDILARQAEQGWGARVIERLAHDLRTSFPDMQGFSPRNLKYMCQWEPKFPQSWELKIPHLGSGLGLVRTDEACLEFVLEPIRVAPDVQGHGVMQQAVEDGGGDDAIAEDIAPGREALVAGEDHWTALVAPADQLEVTLPPENVSLAE